MIRETYIDRLGREAWDKLPECKICHGEGFLADLEFGGYKSCDPCDCQGKILPQYDDPSVNAGECC